MPLHKHCHSRSSVYKRSPSSNNSQRTSIIQEESVLDQKFHKIHNDAFTVINKELEETNRSREMIYEKFEKIDAKIQNLLEFQNDVLYMRQALCTAENSLEELHQKIRKVEVMNELHSIKSKKNVSQIKHALTEEDAEEELFSSEIAPVHVVF